MGLFDTHAHYDSSRFDEDRHALLSALPQPDPVNPLGVDLVLQCATDLASSRQALALAQAYPHVYAAVGVHPSDADGFSPDQLEEFRQLCCEPKVVAVGECGLEYHYDFVAKDVQKAVLEQMLQLSEEQELPIVLHDREAHGDICQAIYAHPRAYGVIHSFSGSGEMAKDLTRRGWYISYSGSVTFKNAEGLRATVASVPLDRILVETDAPYLAPVPYRGQRNDSRLCYATLQVLAQCKGLSVEEMAKITKENACRVFKIYT